MEVYNSDVRWSFVVGLVDRIATKREEESRKRKVADVLREGVRKGRKNSPLAPKSFPVSTLILSGGLAVFLPLDSVRHCCTFFLLLLFVYLFPSSLTTIYEEYQSHLIF